MALTRTWQADIYLFEHADHTTAEAVLRAGDSTARVRGRGTARWRNAGTPVPEICDERVMRTVIVYESLFGNTHKIAQAIRDGIRDADAQAEILRLSVAQATQT
jgi:hypothetical protein